MNESTAPNSASEMDKAEGEPPAEKRVKKEEKGARAEQENPVLPADDATLRTEI